jgi:predicted TIM-barrel fold metal-dependent hydrolase
MSGGGRYPRWSPGIELREDWLALVSEEIVEPEREIVDPHHHLWRHGTEDNPAVYELDALRRDTSSGHNVVQTMYIECRSYWDTDAPESFQPVGETRQIRLWADGMAGEKTQIAGMVAYADLRLAELDQVLDAHADAGQGIVKGIRHSAARDIEPDSLMIPGRGDAGLFADPAFRRGVERLGARGLTYDSWHYHHQNRDFIALARAVPETVMVLDHFGTPLGVGRFAGQREAIFDQWRRDMDDLSQCPNVMAKLGGFAMPDNGWGWMDRALPPSSDEIVAEQGKWYRHMLDVFGPDRCMFESNFPVDRVSVSYPVLWNAFKKIAAPLNEAAKDALFSGTARRVYGLPLPA